ncbi:hypothetical protein HDV00_010121 [Rhizophlyctis rosea]|nr:hypothetical protein HDV00_010121 [Rhizophlyctis rosea]
MGGEYPGMGVGVGMQGGHEPGYVWYQQQVGNFYFPFSGFPGGWNAHQHGGGGHAHGGHLGPGHFAGGSGGPSPPLLQHGGSAAGAGGYYPYPVPPPVAPRDASLGGSGGGMPSRPTTPGGGKGKNLELLKRILEDLDAEDVRGIVEELGKRKGGGSG